MQHFCKLLPSIFFQNRIKVRKRRTRVECSYNCHWKHYRAVSIPAICINTSFRFVEVEVEIICIQRKIHISLPHELWCTNSILYTIETEYASKSSVFMIDAEEEYDVFLSFAEEDRAVAEFLIKKPLEECGYLVCWHHDEFLPGHTIEDNMERSIFKSRYTIAIISEAFLASQFCLTELNITRRKMHEISKNCLVPVLADANCSVPPDILKITYVSVSDIALIDRLKARIGNYSQLLFLFK